MRRPSRSELLDTSEVAAKFRVDVKTIRRWAKEGKLPYTKTLGGIYRFKADEVEALYAKHQVERSE